MNIKLVAKQIAAEWAAEKETNPHVDFEGRLPRKSRARVGTHG